MVVEEGVQLVVDGHDRQGRDFLTPSEITQLLDAAKTGRHGVRDHALLLTMYRHGYRVSELCEATLNDLSLAEAHIWVRRKKGSMSTQQPIEGDELSALRRYLRTRSLNQRWLFLSERNGPLTRNAVYYLVRRAGEKSGLPFPVHPHMLRHSCGYYLANKGYDLRLIQDYLGHRNPTHTARYTRTASTRFQGLWK